MFEESRSKLRGMFCRAAVLRIDRKKFCLILDALAAVVQTT